MKLIAKIFGSLILILVLILAAGFFYLDSIVEESVARFGPEITGTPVSLERSSLKPWNGAGSLQGLAIGNPEQFGSENAFSLGEIEVDVELSSLSSDVILVNRVAIIQPEVLYLHDGSTDNLRALLANITSRLGEGGADAESESNAKKIIIEEFVFSDGQISANHALMGDQRLTINLPDLRLEGIGEDSGGATLKEAGEQIFTYLNWEIRSQVGSSEIYAQTLQQIESRVQAELENLEEQARQQLEQIEEVQQIREVEDQVRGLLDAFNR